ncbi:hypothetical protein SO802_022054 [Lithocarpus litseifolius]|uniref:Uncharacterized protein n=1 Tax=Lithocarpus litseifolius TaxID=425828 RepID=A0AAW2CIN6_9ROSI
MELEDLVRCSTKNYVPLTPISFLERAAKAYRDTTSIVNGSVKYTWGDMHERCLKIASALNQLGISRGDVVATLAPNVPAMHELHFAVPMAGALICPLNTRHDSAMLSVLLEHSKAKIIFVDYQLLDIAHGALKLLTKTKRKPPILVLIAESDGPLPTDHIASETHEYECLLAAGHNGFEIIRPNTRQGVHHVGLEDVEVKDPVTMASVPADGKTIGEIMFRDLEATKEAFNGGWFRSGDLAVKHPDNYIEVKDQLNDVIISGGENISTVEVEIVLYSHPAILEAAVVARPDNHWGQTPCAFVKLKEGYDGVGAQEIIKFC